MKHYYVYILANPLKTLYTGVTSDLQRRLYEHKHHQIAGFISKYHVTRLVYFEETSDVQAAHALRMTGSLTAFCKKTTRASPCGRPPVYSSSLAFSLHL